MNCEGLPRPNRAFSTALRRPADCWCLWFPWRFDGCM